MITANPDRYTGMQYRRVGKSGLKLPADIAWPLAQFRRPDAL